MTSEEQKRLIESFEFEYLGNGPEATGGHAWYMSTDIYFKCTECGYMMVADPFTYDNCFCGAMRKDADMGRFGSRLGDNSIEVYRKHQKGRSALDKFLQRIKKVRIRR